MGVGRRKSNPLPVSHLCYLHVFALNKTKTPKRHPKGRRSKSLSQSLLLRSISLLRSFRKANAPATSRKRHRTILPEKLPPACAESSASELRAPRAREDFVFFGTSAAPGSAQKNAAAQECKALRFARTAQWPEGLPLYAGVPMGLVHFLQRQFRYPLPALSVRVDAKYTAETLHLSVLREQLTRIVKCLAQRPPRQQSPFPLEP